MPTRSPQTNCFQTLPTIRSAPHFAALVRAVEIVDFRFHDLRHTAASWLRMQGADIHTVAQLLGHKDLRMAARYQHLSPAFLADAVGRLDTVFGELRYRTKSNCGNSDCNLLMLFGVPYGNRTRVAAVKEKRFTGIQRKPAAWIAPVRSKEL